MVLSDEEVADRWSAANLLACTDNPKHGAVMMTCYAAGLRLREATHLRVKDLDGRRGQLHIVAGKGSKERFVPASPRLLEELREYWKMNRPQDYLFPGKAPSFPVR